MASVSASTSMVSEPPRVLSSFVGFRQAARSSSAEKQARRCAPSTSGSMGLPSASSAQEWARFQAPVSGAMESRTSSACPPESRTRSAAPTAAKKEANNVAGACIAASGVAASSEKAPELCRHALTNGAEGSMRKRNALSTSLVVSTCSSTSRASVLLPAPRGPQTSIDWPRPRGESVSTEIRPVVMPSLSGTRCFCVGVGRSRQETTSTSPEGASRSGPPSQRAAGAAVPRGAANQYRSTRKTQT
mmetsp:Transcript_107982/g.344739  ORF Transcript_107982/g.344739 Transcript_107982/m.344739 type:complete len:246 (+) Transcript_107982:938-1675(+)